MLRLTPRLLLLLVLCLLSLGATYVVSNAFSEVEEMVSGLSLRSQRLEAKIGVIEKKTLRITSERSELESNPSRSLK